MKIGVDIDGTLAWPNIPILAQKMNEQWQLGIAEERLTSLRRKVDLLALPEMLAVREEMGEKPFVNRFEWFYFRSDILTAALVVDGAVETVQRLASEAEVVYCTARYGRSEEEHAEIKQATYQWLAAHAFPNPENIIFCKRMQDKLLYLAKIASTCRESVLHIDDSAAQIITFIPGLLEKDQAVLREWLTLAAIHTKEKPLEVYGVRYLVVKRWNTLEEAIRKEE